MILFKINFTVVGADDTAELDVFAQLDRHAGPDALRKEGRAGQPAEQADLADEFLPSAGKGDGRFLLRSWTEAPAQRRDV